jgi:hypothetical protein
MKWQLKMHQYKGDGTIIAGTVPLVCFYSLHNIYLIRRNVEL